MPLMKVTGKCQCKCGCKLKAKDLLCEICIRWTGTRSHGLGIKRE